MSQQNSTPEPETNRTSHTWEKAFLTALAKTGNVTKAARAAKIDRSTAYKLRDEQPDFALAWQAAREEAADLLEAEAHRRAVTGTLEPVYYQGKRCGTIRRYSDTLLVVLLKANRPTKFRERHDVLLSKIDYSRLSTEQLQRIAAGDDPVEVILCG